MIYSKAIIIAACILLSTYISAVAGDGDKVGGGGDATEAHVDEIRSDIQSWIEKGGASNLTFPDEFNLEQYKSKMNAVLALHAVLVSFTDKPITISGIEKTCAWTPSLPNQQASIQCNIDRFKKTSGSDQYVLIHHEFASLAGIEQNIGASSDYFISNQLVEYLDVQLVLKLSIKKTNRAKNKELIKTVEEKLVAAINMCVHEEYQMKLDGGFPFFSWDRPRSKISRVFSPEPKGCSKMIFRMGQLSPMPTTFRELRDKILTFCYGLSPEDIYIAELVKTDS